MATRQFNGHEVAFLMGWDEVGNSERVLELKKLGQRDDGYAYLRVVICHPDGKLYQFEVANDSAHGITPCLEWPNELTEAIEVEPVEVVMTTYRVKP